MLINQWSSRFI